ncbi:hypothetical protein HPMBJEAJ_00029 [Aeromonas phage avDM6]|nr:hypothetical protein HPMBJEAJ_00029 [Aeromonas phage avDM6]
MKLSFSQLNEMCGGNVAVVDAYTFGKNFVIWNVCGYDNVYHQVKVPLQKISRSYALELLEYDPDQRVRDYELEHELHQYDIGIFIDGDQYSACNSKHSFHSNDYERWPINWDTPVNKFKLGRIAELEDNIQLLRQEIVKIKDSMNGDNKQ